MHASAAGLTAHDHAALPATLLPLGLVGLTRRAPMIDDRWEKTVPDTTYILRGVP